MKFSVVLSLIIVSVHWLSFPAYAQDSKGINPFGTTIIPLNYVATTNAGASAGNNLFDPDGETQDPAQVMFESTRTSSISDAASDDSAESMANYTTSFTLDAGTGVVTGSFTGTVSGSAVNGPGFQDDPAANADATLRFSFEVESDSAMFEVMGNGQASGTPGPSIGSVSVELEGGSSTLIQRSIVGDGGSDSGSISESVTLGRGPYTFRIRVGGEAEYENSGDLGTTTFSATVTANVTITPVRASESIFWAANDGTFNVASNWEPAQAPGADDTVVFDRGADYTVTIPPTSTGRALVERGSVSFSGGPYNILGSDASAPSLVVGNSTSDEATLFVGNTQLTSVNATIGLGSNTDGVVQNFDGGAWRIDNALIVGDAGEGSLSIANDSPVAAGMTVIGNAANSTGFVSVTGASTDTTTPLDTGPLTVGNAGTGTLSISDAKVQSGEALIGEMDASTGTVNVGGATGNGEWTLGGALTIGDRGNGTLAITSGSVSTSGGESVTVGRSEGSTGFATVQGIDSFLGTLGGLFVGSNGMGNMLIDGGAMVQADFFNIGGLNRGDVSLGGSIVNAKGVTHSTIDVTTFQVGTFGRGILAVFDDALVTAETVDFGTGGPGGNATIEISESGVIQASGDISIGELDPADVEFAGKATVTLLSSSLLSGDRVLLREGSTINGSFGIIRVQNGLIDQGGTLAGLNNVEDLSPLKQELDPIGSLMIDGDLMKTGGVIEIGVRGLSAEEFGVLEVTGNADLTDATVRFVFVDGFLPQTGNMIPFLEVGGTLTMTPLAMEFEGVAEGFDFQVNEMDGMLMFEALNNAQALAQPPVGCSAGGGSGGASVMFPLLIVAITLRALRREKLRH